MAEATTATPARRRGRPRNSDGRDTAASLLDAAAAACAARGFDGATMSEIASRAGVTPAAIYNHFGSREELLYAAGVRGLERFTEVVPSAPGTDALRQIAVSYLNPDLQETRRLLAELHLAGGRDPKLADLLASWHREWERVLLGVVPADDPTPEATIKALFLLLLGLCHLEDLDAVEARHADVVARVGALVDALVPPAG